VAVQPQQAALTLIADTIRERIQRPADIAKVLAEVQNILDDGVKTGHIAEGPAQQIDLSRIDFDRLCAFFNDHPHKQTSLESLKAAVSARLGRMLRINRTRTEYLKRYEELIARYNDGSRTIDEIFAELLTLCRDLDDEDQRHVRENLSEEELVIFDLLTRPDPVLTPAERDTVKLAVKLMHERLRHLLAPGWRERVTARAEVKHEVENLLDGALPAAYTRAIFTTKATLVFQHLIDHGETPQSAG
jgi:type I restriction enzyme R subunit